MPKKSEQGGVVTRHLPYNEEAEQALLGSILLNNRSFETVAAFLRPEHFAVDVHRKMFSLCATLINRGERADPITLRPFLDSDPALAAVGGFRYALELIHPGAAIIKAIDYGHLIHDLALRRALIAIHQEGLE
ncbi:MAG: replicative DNA helicase, partial [Alphaproteobacteria bacterium]|nr:replicative DNA helicase [Alphaproteobacteria bacterium]